MTYKNLTAVLILMIFTAIFPAAFGAEPVSKEVVMKTISAADSFKMIGKNRKNKDFLLLDVRTPDEFTEKHIKGAVNIDYHAADFAAGLNKLDKSKTILIYCRTGNRSGKTLPIMRELGFRKVYNMGGGIVDWEAGNYPLVKNNQAK